MPLLRERLEQPNKQPNSFPASTGQDSCRRAVRIVDIDQKMPGWNLHPLSGDLDGHWSAWVNGNWRMTFAFEGEDAVLVDYQDYH